MARQQVSPESTSAAVPPARSTGRIYYGWWMLAVIVLCMVSVYGIVQYSFGLFVKPVSAEFGLSRSQANLGLVAFLGGAAIWYPVVGWLFDRYSMRLIMTLGALLFGGAMTLIGVATAPWMIGLLLALPATAGGVMIGQLAIGVGLSRWFQRNRALAFGIGFAGMSGAGAIVPPIAAVLIHQFGWRHTVMMEGATAGLLLALLCFLIVRDSPADKGIAIEPPLTGADGAVIEDDVTQTWTVPQLLRTRLFWGITIPIVLLTAFDGTLLGSFIPALTDEGMDIQHATFIFASLNFASVLGKFLPGVLTKRFDKRHIFIAIALANVVMAVVMFMAPQFAVLLPVACILGFAAGATLPIWLVLIGEYFGMRSLGTVQGAMTFVLLVVMITSIYLAGVCFDRTHTYNLVWIVSFAASIVAAAMMFGLPRAKPAIASAASAVTVAAS